MWIWIYCLHSFFPLHIPDFLHIVYFLISFWQPFDSFWTVGWHWTWFAMCSSVCLLDLVRHVLKLQLCWHFAHAVCLAFCKLKLCILFDNLNLCNSYLFLQAYFSFPLCEPRVFLVICREGEQLIPASHF